MPAGSPRSSDIEAPYSCQSNRGESAALPFQCQDPNSVTAPGRRSGNHENRLSDPFSEAGAHVGVDGPLRHRMCGAVGPSVRVDNRPQHDAALLGVVVAGTAMHGCALVPNQQIADPPRMVIGKAFLGGVRGEFFD